jgi:hypothetical protein
MYKGQPIKPTLFEFWHSSDRPPLQAAADLLVYPVAPPVSPVLFYQLLSIFLQCTCLTGLWILLRAAGLGNRYLIPILGFCVFSTLVVFHSFFVWPKLLCATFLFISLAFVFLRVWTGLEITLATCALSLSLLSHMSVAFTLIPLAIFIVAARRLPNWRGVAMGIAIVLVFLLPWRWFQTVYDPPGDFLLKFNMTDTTDPNRIGRPFGELLYASYKNMSAADWITIRVEDLKSLYTSPTLAFVYANDWRRALSSFESANFFQLFWAIGLLNVAFAVRFFAPKTPALKLADLALILAASSAVLWMILLYGPGATVIHAWSLANVLLIFAALVIYLVEAQPRLLYPLLALQILTVFPLFVFAKPFIEEQKGAVMDGLVDPGMAAFALMFFGAILFMGWRAKLQGVA